MKWSRAIHHVETLANSCADTMAGPSIFELRVTGLWAAGDLLEPPQDRDWVPVALAVDLPAAEVPWFSEPRGGRHWANAIRLTKNPVLTWWRSAQAPVWNHRIVRPVLVWDVAGGVREDALEALRDGQAEPLRPPAPSDDEFRERMRAELAVSLAALRTCTGTYDRKRWSPGKLEPVADELWRASDGYLDVLDALS
jgi:hypothetical protein